MLNGLSVNDVYSFSWGLAGLCTALTDSEIQALPATVDYALVGRSASCPFDAAIADSPCSECQGILWRLARVK